MSEKGESSAYFEIIPKQDKCIILINPTLIKEEHGSTIFGYVQLKVDEFFEGKKFDKTNFGDRVERKIISHPNGSMAICYFDGEKNIYQRIFSGEYIVITLTYFEFFNKLVSIISSAAIAYMYPESLCN